MTELQTQYQVAGIVDICSSCEKWANRTLNKIRDGIAPAMRQAITERVGKKPFRLLRPFRTLVRILGSQ